MFESIKLENLSWIDTFSSDVIGEIEIIQS